MAEVLDRPVAIAVTAVRFGTRVINAPVPFLLFGRFDLFPNLLLPGVVFDVFVRVPGFT